MKISISNFKSIKEIRNFEINFTTLLSGVNSSGKTSFIQLLLLLKQTIEKKSINDVLVLNEPYVELGKFEDIIYNHDINNLLEIELTLDKDDMNVYKDEKSILEILNPENCSIILKFKNINNQIIVHYVKINYFLPENTVKTNQFIEFTHSEKNNYKIFSNTGIFDKFFYTIPEPIEGIVTFAYFLPLTIKTEIENLDYPDFDKNQRKMMTIEPELDNIKKIIECLFAGFSYIGPLREKPQSAYEKNTNDTYIGTKGEFTAFFLEKEAQNPITYFLPEFTDESVTFSKKEDTLINAVKFWLCDVFKLAKDIETVENGDDYYIYIINKTGLKVSIKHVGFGISQILPIIVEGLRMKPTGTLILEQPEIHLHPKIQSLLFDFLNSLTLNNKKIIIETHSDHLITRMRRRIAEDVSNNLQDKISLMFIEEDEHGSLFRFLDFNELGSLALYYYPKNFVEQLDEEYRAIVKAQSRKRLNNKK